MLTITDPNFYRLVTVVSGYTVWQKALLREQTAPIYQLAPERLTSDPPPIIEFENPKSVEIPAGTSLDWEVPRRTRKIQFELVVQVTDGRLGVRSLFMSTLGVREVFFDAPSLLILSDFPHQTWVEGEEGYGHSLFTAPGELAKLQVTEAPTGSIQFSETETFQE